MKKAIWLLVTCLMVAALVLSSCKEAAPAEQTGATTVVGKTTTTAPATTTPTTPTTPTATTPVDTGPVMVRDALGNMKEQPRYGGTITFIWAWPLVTQDLDPVYSTRGHLSGVLTYGRLGTADWSKGPQGTGELGFESSIIPDAYLMGDVVESWDVMDMQTIVFTLRDNVYWHNKPPMNGRQFTVDDVDYSFARAQTDARNVYYTADVPDPDDPPFFLKIDDRTFQIWYDDPSIGMLSGLMGWVYMQARETVELVGDMEDPKYQAGIGPWVFEDVVVDSSITWSRNPRYHLVDPFFPENRLPYADKLKVLIVMDTATQLAALRTHKTDWQGVPSDKVEGMQQSNPELKWVKLLPDASNTLWPRNDIAPFSGEAGRLVRQAISLAIDQPAILEEYYNGNAYMLTWPVMPTFPDVYTPLEDLPEDLRMLFEHHPDRARELLTEAGYPNGFTTDVQVSAGNARGIEVMSLVQGWLAEVGITMTIDVVESTTFGNQLWVSSFPGMSYISWGNNGLDDAWGWANGGWVSDAGQPSVYAFSEVVDPEGQAVFDAMRQLEDADERNRIRREQNLRHIDLSYEIPIPTPAVYSFWVPWLKGYVGERSVGQDPVENPGVLMYVWVDQDLKYDTTGLR